MSLYVCGNLSDTGKENNTISLNTCSKETIQIAFEALKNANSKEFNQFAQYTERREGLFIYKDTKLFGNDLDGEDKEFIKSIFEKFSYNIGEVKEHGDVTTAQVQIMNCDLSNIYEDTLRYTYTDNPLIEAIKSTDNKMITTDLKITLKKTDGIMDSPNE